MKKVALHNLGCKVNAYETQAMEKLLREKGYEIVPFKEGADIYIINTCTVTNIADRKSRQMLHKAKKMNPDAIVVAAGCYVQTAGENAQVDEAIDILVGNNKKKDIISILEEYENNHAKRVACLDIGQTNEFEEMELGVETEHTRVNLKVQDGCNQFCSYCIIPYARGRIRSLPKYKAVEQVEQLVAQGFKEVVLTGIHISSYGKDLEEQEDLLTLIKAVHQVEGLQRLRLGSLEPRIITEDFVREISKLSKFCPHFHLSLQSGSRSVLERMNRHYTPEEYKDKCELIRKYFEKPAFTTDVIVGFPGESEEEFEESRRFLDEIDFYEVHVFKYSKRQGTRAATMKNQVAENVKALRSDLLIQDGKRREMAYRESFLGEEEPVLFEEKQEINGKKYWVGHTKEYLRVAVCEDGNLKNEIVDCKIVEFLQDDLLFAKRI